MHPDNRVDTAYTVIHCETRMAINEQQYLRLTMANAFETITANCWLNSYSGPVSFAKNEVVQVIGQRKMLDLKSMINIHRAVKLNNLGRCALTTIPHSQVANSEDLLLLIQLVDNLSSNALQCFVYDALSDRGFAIRFCNLPASHQYHHSFSGGLLRHSLECASIVAQCPALSPSHQELGTVAALFHDGGKVLTMQPGKKTALGYLVDHDSLTLSALHHPLQKLDLVWPDAAMGLRHIWTCQSSKRWGFKAKTPIATAVQMADQISAKNEHERQAFANAPAWRNNASHPVTGERFWRISSMEADTNRFKEVRHV